jgi:hypothetical protein
MDWRVTFPTSLPKGKFPSLSTPMRLSHCRRRQGTTSLPSSVLTSGTRNRFPRTQLFIPGERDCVLTFSEGRLPSLVKTTAPSTGEPCVRTCNSLSGTANSAKPHCKQTTSFGKTQTMGLSRPSSPGKWIAISPLKTLCFSEWHPLQVMAWRTCGRKHHPYATAGRHRAMFKIEHLG